MTFLSVKGYEGIYEVSHEGIIRSVDRVVRGSDGTHYPFRGRQLTPYPHVDLIYPMVSLWQNGKGTSHYLHRLVAQAFIPNPERLPEVNHIDGNRLNPKADNLEWVTSVENKLHAIQTGLRVYTHRLSKDEFVECLQQVIDGESYASLCDRVPYRVPFLSVKLRKLAQELGVEDLLDASLREQRIIRARTNGAKNHLTH